MAQLITPSGGGDTRKTIEDKTRALPVNQGLNEWEMWQKIDIEVAQAIAASTYRPVVRYDSGNGGNTHGAK